jgi:DNA adenine methylase
MKPFFCRTGSKSLMSSDLINMFPAHKTYVELFLGGGAVFFKKEPSEYEIINDLDKELMKDYRLIRNSPKDITTYIDDLNTFSKISKFYRETQTTKQNILLKSIIKRCNGFGGKPVTNFIYKSSNPFSKIKNISKYINRLSNTKILSFDYKTIIKRYDSTETFFYLDPPYEGSKKLYDSSYIDYLSMSHILKNIKGKFILSINDSSNIRSIFHMFIIKQITIEPQGQHGIGKNIRKELIIKNF